MKLSVAGITMGGRRRGRYYDRRQSSYAKMTPRERWGGPKNWAGAVMVFVGVLLIPVVIGLPILLLGLLLALDGLG